MEYKVSLKEKNGLPFEKLFLVVAYFFSRSPVDGRDFADDGGEYANSDVFDRIRQEGGETKPAV